MTHKIKEVVEVWKFMRHVEAITLLPLLAMCYANQTGEKDLLLQKCMVLNHQDKCLMNHLIIRPK